MKKRRDTQKEGPGNHYLDSLWSKAVKAKSNGYCVVCYAKACDAHHIVHRRQNWALRWDVENGVALCRKCHDNADTLYMQQRILEMVNKDYLSDMQLLYPLKMDYLEFKHLTETEFRFKKSRELKLMEFAMEGI